MPVRPVAVDGIAAARVVVAADAEREDVSIVVAAVAGDEHSAPSAVALEVADMAQTVLTPSPLEEKAVARTNTAFAVAAGRVAPEGVYGYKVVVAVASPDWSEPDSDAEVGRSLELDPFPGMPVGEARSGWHTRC